MSDFIYYNNIFNNMFSSHTLSVHLVKEAHSSLEGGAQCSETKICVIVNLTHRSSLVIVLKNKLNGHEMCREHVQHVPCICYAQGNVW